MSVVHGTCPFQACKDLYLRQFQSKINYYFFISTYFHCIKYNLVLHIILMFQNDAHFYKQF